MVMDKDREKGRKIWSEVRERVLKERRDNPMFDQDFTNNLLENEIAQALAVERGDVKDREKVVMECLESIKSKHDGYFPCCDCGKIAEQALEKLKEKS